MSIKPKSASHIAYSVQGMIRACICADDTCMDVDKMFGGSNGVYWTLEVAEELMGELVDRIEVLERQAPKPEPQPDTPA